MPGKQSKKTIIIVEDNENIRDLIRYIFNKDVYQLKVCSTIRALNTELAKQLPDLILLDVLLPDGNGTERCREIKQDPFTSHIPVLLMSALHDPDLRNIADAVINKPFNTSTLRTTIEQYL